MGAGASSPRVQGTPGEPKEEKRKVAKIPLNIALVAIVKIQTRWRIVLALRRFEAVRLHALEERRRKELIRLARAAELDEIIPLETSAPLRTVPGKLNWQNRFLRKIATKTQLEDMKSIDVYQEGKGEAAMILTKYSPLDNNHLIIHPLVGFVIKSRSNRTGKKIFINICHHESIVTMVAAPVREVTDTVAAGFTTDSMADSVSRPFTANSGYNLSTANGHTGLNHNNANNADSVIQIGDIVLPSQEFEECFVRDDDAGLVPVDPRVRQEIAKQAVKYWNLTHDDDVVLACTFPKIKRGYFGDLLPLSLELKAKTVTHVPSALYESTTLQTELAKKDEKSLFSSFAVAQTTRGANNPLEPFHLPFATEFRSWVDVAAVGTDLSLPDTYYGKSPVQVAASLAVLTHVQSLDSHGHSVKFSSRDLDEHLVRELRAESFVPQVPLFGPAYAAQTGPVSTSASALAQVGSTLSASALPSIPGAQGATAVASKTVLVAPPSVEPVPPVTAKPAAHNPRTPGKAGRSATIGPGSPQRTTKPSNFSSDAVFEDANKAARTGTAWRPSGATSLKVPAQRKEKVDDFGVALEHFSTELAALKTATTLNEEEEKNEENVTEEIQEVSEEPPKTEVAPEVTRSTVPAFVVISQGVLYLYNRDPTRSHYYPFKPPKKRNRHSKHASDPSLDELPFSPAKAKAPSPVGVPVFRPLVLYARIMLTDTCVTTSTCDNDQHTPLSHCAHYLHFAAPSAPFSAAEDALAQLFSHFGTALPERNVTIKVRSFSELRTWKAHLRSHIHLGKLARRRIFHQYGGNTEVNRYLLGRTVPFKLGDLTLRTSNSEGKCQVRLENGILSLFDAQNPDQQEDRNPFFSVGLGDKSASLLSETQADNSTNIVLSLTADKPNATDNVDFELVFPRPYSMIETESSEYLEAIQVHIEQARARVSAAVLPLLEHKTGLSMPGQRADITNVKLAVGGSDDIDSDDEDADEAEAALRRHTLLTTLYVSHPFPDQLAKDTVDLILSDPANRDISVAITKNDPNEVHNVIVKHENEGITEEIITSLQKGMGEMPPFTIVLVDKMLYFFHAMRYYFSLNLSHLGEKLSYKRARALHKAEVLKLKHDILHKRMKESVFNIDSSSEDEQSDRDEREDPDEKEENIANTTTMSGYLSRGPSTSSLSLDGFTSSFQQPASSLTPSRPTNRNPGVRGNPRPRPVKSIDAAAPTIEDVFAEDVEKVEKMEKVETVRRVVAVKKPPAVKPERTLPMSAAPSNYSITTWSIRLVSYDNRSYTMNFKSAQEYEHWRQLLFEAGAEPPVPEEIEPEIELFLPPKKHTHTHTQATPREGRLSENQKEDAVQQAELTNNPDKNDDGGEINNINGNEDALTPLASPARKASNIFFPAMSGVSGKPGVDKLDVKYVDIDALKKYARLLRKDEQVLACGQVLKHDVLPPSKTPTPSSRKEGNGSKQRRILVLTDMPRLLFLDPVGNIVRGNLELTSAVAKVEVKTPSAVDFEVVISGVANKFTSTEIPDKNAAFWATKIKQAINQR